MFKAPISTFCLHLIEAILKEASEIIRRISKGHVTNFNVFSETCALNCGNTKGLSHVREVSQSKTMAIQIGCQISIRYIN